MSFGILERDTCSCTCQSFERQFIKIRRVGSLVTQKNKIIRSIPDLHFYFHFKGREHDFVALENHVERRVIGKKVRLQDWEDLGKLL